MTPSKLLAAFGAALAFAASADGPNPRIAYVSEVMLHRIPADEERPGSLAPATIDGAISVSLKGSGFVGSYTASLACPPEIRPKDAANSPFTRSTPSAVTQPTTHQITVPNSDVAGHAATVWRCSLRVTVYNPSGEKALDDWLPVTITYASSTHPGAPIFW